MAIRCSSLGLSAVSYLILLAELGCPAWGRWRGRMQRRTLIVVAPPLGPLVGGLHAAAIGA